MIHEFPGPAGPLEGLLEEPGGGAARAAVVLGHPHPLHGGTMHTKALYHAAKGLLRAGCAVLRFNFRGVGRSAGTFDEGRGEMEDLRAAIDFVAARYAIAELWTGGFSFGAWVGMTVGAGDDRVSALIGIAAPVDRHDFSAVLRSEKPTFLVHGERDEVVPLSVVRQFYAQLPEPKELVIIDAADHLFDGKVSEVGEAVEDLLADFTSREA